MKKVQHLTGVMESLCPCAPDKTSRAVLDLLYALESHSV